jgi:hypothetical protein
VLNVVGQPPRERKCAGKRWRYGVQHVGGAVALFDQEVHHKAALVTIEQLSPDTAFGAGQQMLR